MTNFLLPKEVTALVHHVELNRAGWWDKAVHRLVLAAVWLSDHTPSTDEIRTILEGEFRLKLSKIKLSSALDSLESQGMLIKLPDASYRIPEQQRLIFEKEIADAESVESNAQAYFVTLVTTICDNLDAKDIWRTFESEFLTPLINEVGANTYRLIAGEQIVVTKDLTDHFLSRFLPKFHPKLNELIKLFLDPKKEEIRAYISRMLHARFCVDASGLPEDVIQKISAAVGKQIHFRIFVDTNFLFSLLELHENPSNASARELQNLISQLKSNPKVEFFITSRTIDEAKRSIAAAKSQLSGIPAGRNFTQAALQVGFSGMVERFLSERLQRGVNLSAENWFDPYLMDFVPIAREKGIELFDEKLDSYAVRQDVIDDIHLVQEYEKRRFELSRRKSYDKLAHDMILWHFVTDKRAAYIESPIEAKEWILTVDFRLIGFDEHKQKTKNTKVPLCLHPTSLVQLLQFWVPRTKEFDVDAERTSLKILKGLGRFEGSNEISEQTITNVILNEGLRSRLKSDQPEEAEIALIRDALVEEVKAQAAEEANKSQQLQNRVRESDAALLALDAKMKAKDEEIAELKTKVDKEETGSKAVHKQLEAQSDEIIELKSKWQRMEESKKQRRSLFGYFGLLVVVILVAVLAALLVDVLLPQFAKIIGKWPIRLLGGILIFVVGHLVLECCVKGKERMTKLWPFKQILKFRKRLWTIVILVFLVGVLGNLYANHIQKNLDKPATIKGSQSIANIPTRLSLEIILKQHRKNEYHQMCEKLPYIHKVLDEKFSTIPPEKEEPRFIAELMTTFFLSEGSDSGEPILFKDKTSPQRGISLYEWVENYEDAKVGKFSDIEKINTRIGKIIYDFIYEKVLDYLERVKLDNSPNHKELRKAFVDTAVREICLEKLSTDFDVEMANRYDEQRKKELLKFYNQHHSDI